MSLDALKKFYEIKDMDELETVLERHPELTEFALDAAKLFVDTLDTRGCKSECDS